MKKNLLLYGVFLCALSNPLVPVAPRVVTLWIAVA